MEAFANIISLISSFLYSYILIALLIAAGLYFTIKTGFIQFRLFGESIRVIAEKREDRESISSFQALMVSTASRVGTGNVVGVTGAIIAGGAGARVLDVAHRHHRQCLRLYRIHPRTDL